MSSVGLTSRGVPPIGDARGFGGAAATTRQRFYCKGCDRIVATVANDEILCPLCNGRLSEGIDITTPTAASLHHFFPSSAFDYEDEFSWPLPPPPPPFLTADDATVFCNPDVIASSSTLPPPPAPAPPILSSPSRPHPRNRVVISGLEIDLSEPLDDYLADLPPPPLPPTTHRRTLRLPQLPQGPPPLPPPGPESSSRSSRSWNCFFPFFDSDDVPGRSRGAAEEEVDMFLVERTMPEEQKSWEEGTARCAVCLDDLESNQVVKGMPCKHAFHSDCITPWLESHHTCPVCRYELPCN